MKQYMMIYMVLILTLTALNGYASPKKEGPKPAKEVPSALTNSPEQTTSLSGKVVETMNAGGYTYICIEKNGKQTWVAVPDMSVSVGQNMTFQPGQEMKHFTSKSLNRTFDSIIFSGGPASTPVSLSQSKAGEAAKHGGSKAAAVKPGEKISIEKATGPNAYSIGEIFSQKTKLNQKTAVVKAKVTKVSVGIMGKNWIHLQDGTGDAAKGTNDLIATSQDQPAAGDVITIKGTLYKDKDFGSGYKYSVIMENAKIQP